MNAATRPTPEQFDNEWQYVAALRGLKSLTATEYVCVLRYDLENLEELRAEGVTQYQSECALYGDAGPGQGLAVVKGAQQIADLRAKLARAQRIASRA
jgi:hypothetical protein